MNKEELLKFKKAIKKAETLNIKADLALSKLNLLINLKGFDYLCEHLPQFSMCNGSEIILEYNGSELDITEVLNLMEEKGFIHKDDFIGN